MLAQRLLALALAPHEGVARRTRTFARSSYASPPTRSFTSARASSSILDNPYHHSSGNRHPSSRRALRSSLPSLNLALSPLAPPRTLSPFARPRPRLAPHIDVAAAVGPERAGPRAWRAAAARARRVGEVDGAAAGREGVGAGG